MGQMDDAIRIAEQSVQLAEAGGDETLAGEASLRLAVTLNNVAAGRGGGAAAPPRGWRAQPARPALEARALLSLGVARTRTRDERSGAEAFRAALARRARGARAGRRGERVDEPRRERLRRGDFVAAHDACQDALRLYTTLRSNTNRLDRAVQPGEPGARARRCRGGAGDLSGDGRAGRAARRDRHRDRRARRGRDRRAAAAPACRWRARRWRRRSGRSGRRIDWWFQGRELLESLEVRIAALDGDIDRRSAAIPLGGHPSWRCWRCIPRPGWWRTVPPSSPSRMPASGRSSIDSPHIRRSRTTSRSLRGSRRCRTSQIALPAVVRVARFHGVSIITYSAGRLVLTLYPVDRLGRYEPSVRDAFRFA